MRALGLWGLAILVAGAAALYNGPKRVADEPKGNTNAATNKYIVEIEKVCCSNAAFIIIY